MIIYQKTILRIDLKTNPGAFYVFGDNLERKGMGGQAREMRGEPNAIGIATKRSPSVFLKDRDFDEWWGATRHQITFMDAQHRSLRNAIVFPADGIGTGLANLSAQAPKIWRHLCDCLAEIGIKNGVHAAAFFGHVPASAVPGGKNFSSSGGKNG